MKLEVTKREISHISVDDRGIDVELHVTIQHGRVAKTETTLSIVHNVEFEPDLIGEVERLTLADAIAQGVREANQQADAAVEGIRALDAL